MKNMKSSIWAKIFLVLSIVFSILTFRLLSIYGIYDQKGGLSAIILGSSGIIISFFGITFLFSREISKVFRLAISMSIAALLIGVSHVEKIEKVKRQRDHFANMVELQKKTQALWTSISVSSAGCDDKIMSNSKNIYASCVVELKKISEKQLNVDVQFDAIFQSILADKQNDNDVLEFYNFIRKARGGVLLQLNVYTNSMVSLFQFLEENDGKISVKNNQILFTTDEAVSQYNRLFESFDIDEQKYNMEIESYSAKFSEWLMKMAQSIEKARN
jgi:hypothetical protein